MMKLKFASSIVLLMVLLMSVGCGAHRQHVRAGDQSMERQEPHNAVHHYRTAHNMKPQSQSIRERLEEAEEMLLEHTIRAVDALVGAGKIDEALEEVRRTAELLSNPDRLDFLEERAEALVLAEAQRRLDAEQYEAALSLIAVHIEAFGDPLLPVAELESEIRQQWGGELQEAGQRHMAAGRHGAAALFYTKANSIGGVGDGGVRAREALERVVYYDAWGLRVGVNVDDARLGNMVDGAFDVALPAAVVDARGGGRFGLEGTVEVTVSDPVFEEWDESTIQSGEYQAGTEMVSNQEYQEAEDELYDLQQRTLEAERDVTEARRDLRDRRRDLQDRQRQGHASSYDENRVDLAYDTVERRERQLEDRRYEEDQQLLELRRIDRYVEVPVYREHSFEVIHQHAELTVQVHAELHIEARDFTTVVEFEAVERDATVWHEAQPRLDLVARRESPPSQLGLQNELDVLIGAEIGEFIDESYELYRRERLGDLSHISKNDRIDKLARFVLLNHRNRDADIEEQLAELAGFGNAGGLLIQLARDEATVR